MREESAAHVDEDNFGHFVFTSWEHKGSFPKQDDLPDVSSG
jgi:hypothetical protein